MEDALTQSRTIIMKTTITLAVAQLGLILLIASHFAYASTIGSEVTRKFTA
jgi:hypothetical protein